MRLAGSLAVLSRKTSDQFLSVFLLFMNFSTANLFIFAKKIYFYDNFCNYYFYGNVASFNARYFLDFIFFKFFCTKTVALSSFHSYFSRPWKKRVFTKKLKLVKKKIRYKYQNSDIVNSFVYLLPNLNSRVKHYLLRRFSRHRVSTRRAVIRKRYRPKFRARLHTLNLLKKKFRNVRKLFTIDYTERLNLNNHIKYMKSFVTNSVFFYPAFTQFAFLSNLKHLTSIFTSIYVLKSLLSLTNIGIWQQFLELILPMPHLIFNKLQQLNVTLIDLPNTTRDKLLLGTTANFLNIFFLKIFSSIFGGVYSVHVKKKFTPMITIFFGPYFSWDLEILQTPYYSPTLNIDTMRMLCTAMQYRSTSLLGKWIQSLLIGRRISHHPRILQYIKSALDYFYENLAEVNAPSFYFVIRGKIGVTGSVRRRQFLYKRGNMSYTNVMLRSSFSFVLVPTKTGVLGATLIMFYDK